jgi:transcriptional regulator with XRE-family HTH domain
MDAKNYWNRALPLIKRKGFTQQSFSTHCGFAKRRIETLIARNRYPEADESENIAKELDTSNTYLVTGAEPGKPDMTDAINKLEDVTAFLKKL